MTLPVEGIGVGVVSGGAVVVFVMKMLPILMRKFNGRNRINKNSIKPGEAKVCRDRGEKIAEHDQAILGICGNVDRIEKQMEIARTENREDHQLMFKKLDNLRK